MLFFIWSSILVFLPLQDFFCSRSQISKFGSKTRGCVVDVIFLICFFFLTMILPSLFFFNQNTAFYTLFLQASCPNDMNRSALKRRDLRAFFELYKNLISGVVILSLSLKMRCLFSYNVVWYRAGKKITCYFALVFSIFEIWKRWYPQKIGFSI